MDMRLTRDTCGEKIISPEEGRIEWYSFDDENGIRKLKNLRLVHEMSASPLKKIKLKRKGCAFDLLEEYFVPEGAVESRSLVEFLGPDGLMRLLSFIAKGEFPTAEVLRMIKRLNIPGYETARHYFRRAVLDGVISPETPGRLP